MPSFGPADPLTDDISNAMLAAQYRPADLAAVRGYVVPWEAVPGLIQTGAHHRSRSSGCYSGPAIPWSERRRRGDRSGRRIWRPAWGGYADPDRAARLPGSRRRIRYGQVPTDGAIHHRPLILPIKRREEQDEFLPIVVTKNVHHFSQLIAERGGYFGGERS
jgi:hypothetical protein